MKKLCVLDLFSGIGGFSLGLERTGGFETVAFCEIEEFPRRVLAKHWPDVPCFEDVRKLEGRHIDGPIDVICGGYPCQPFSTAGKRQGAQDDRHLWPEVDRLLDVFRPTWFIGENVAGHVSMGLDEVLSDLEAKGYTARPFVIPACAVDAPHRRDRVWVLASHNDANPDSERSHRTGIHQFGSSQPVDREKCQPGSVREVLAGSGDAEKREPGDVAHAEGERSGSGFCQAGQVKDRDKPADCSADVADPLRFRQSRQGRAVNASNPPAGQIRQVHRTEHDGRWPTEPRVGRVANGVPDRSHRLRALGNAVVPQIPEMIGNAILEAERLAA